MTRKRQRIADFELSSLLLVAAWTLAAASTAYAQNKPAPDAGGDMAVSAAFNAADQNGDGKIDRYEAAAVPEIASKFQRIDTNGDDVITSIEYMRAMGNG